MLREVFCVGGSRLICPSEKGSRCDAVGGFIRADCGWSFFVEEGAVRMLEETDQFCEGAYEHQVRSLPRSEKPWHIWPLWLSNSGNASRVRRHVPQGAVVVELGCAGGVNYFGRRYHNWLRCFLEFTKEGGGLWTACPGGCGGINGGLFITTER